MTQRRIYQNEFPYFITFLTRNRVPLFEKDGYAKLLSKIMFNACMLKRYDIISYQIMPDHVHLLVYQNNIIKNNIVNPSEGALYSKKDSTGRDACALGGYNISQLIHTIKSFYCNQIRDKYDINYSVFQRRFYICIINTHSYLYTVIEYIQCNPIKAELSVKYQRLPYQYYNQLT